MVNISSPASNTGRGDPEEERALLDHLIQKGLADPQLIAASGTSRGGFMAAHFAISDKRVGYFMTFAPLVDLAMIREFQEAENNPLVKKLALEKSAAALAGRSLWMVDRDERVSTDSVIRFARTVTETTQAAAMPAAMDLHVIAEPKSHTVPAGYAEVGAVWLRGKFGLPPTPPSGQ